jgi:hypothetical protein
MDFAVTVVNPTVRAALSVVGLLPTPQLRTAALMALLGTEVTQRAKEHPAMLDHRHHRLASGSRSWSTSTGPPVELPRFSAPGRSHQDEKREW